MDLKRSVTVKTASVRRLAADYSSYERELETYQSKLDQLRQRLNGDDDETTNREIRKQREFYEECQATMHDIRLRLTQAIQQLQTVLTTNVDALKGTEEWDRAIKVLSSLGPAFSSLVPQELLGASAATLSSSSTSSGKPVSKATSSSTSSLLSPSSSSSSTSAASPSRARYAVAQATRFVGTANATAANLPPPAESFEGRYAVAVYGASQAHEGDEAWTLGYELGRALASKQFHLINGGYCGTMESTSAGARCIAGATVEGVICPDTFPQRGEHGNKYLTHETNTPNIPQRIAAFLERSDAFVVLPGSLGTLTELCLTWNCAGVDDISSLPTAPILLFRRPWQAVIEQLRSSIGVPESFFRLIEYVESVEQCVERLCGHREAGRRRSSALAN